MAYRSGYKGKEVEATVKLYKSHRRVYNTDKYYVHIVPTLYNMTFFVHYL